MSKEIDVEISFGDGKTPNKNKRIYSKEAIEKAVESLNSKKIFLHKDVEVDRNISSSLGFVTETKQIENKVQVKITVFDDQMTRLFELHNFKFIPTGYGNVSEDGTITDYELIHISPTLHSAFDNLDGRTEDERNDKMNNEVIKNPQEEKLIRRYRQVKQHEEYQYLHLLEDIMENGTDSDDRTGVGTRKIFGTQLKFSLRDSFPILTTKRTYWKGIVEELLWFIRGDTNANHLSEKGVKIWDGNTTREFLDKQGLNYPEGFIGPGYGWQWRNWNGVYGETPLEISPYMNWTNKNAFVDSPKTAKENKIKLTGIDQLSEALDKIKNKPDDRRILVSAWNPSQVPEMALPPCHLLFQLQVSNGELHCQWYQRSNDFFLGCPFNISSYALLTCLMAKAAGLVPGTLTMSAGDTHIYKNHFQQVKEQLSRKPYPFPTLEIPDVKTIQDMENLTLEDCKLINYQCHPSIKAPMAV